MFIRVPESRCVFEPLFVLQNEEKEQDAAKIVLFMRGDMQPCPYTDRFGLSWQALEAEPSTLIA